MNKRTTEDEAKYQESIKHIKMRTAFVVVYDLMKANDIEYPFAVIWQTYDDNGDEDYTIMLQSDNQSGSWDVNHGDKEKDIAGIVHDHVGKAE